MKHLRLETLALATLLASLTMAAGQQPATPEGIPSKQPALPGQEAVQKQPPSKPVQGPADPRTPAATSLDQLLQQALVDNPDIRVGEAKVHSAEAELHRTRLAVTQRVVAAHSAMTSARANVARLEADYARVLHLSKNAVVDQGTVQEVQAKLMAAKAELAMAEAQLPYLTGQPAVQGSARSWDSTSGPEVDLVAVRNADVLAAAREASRRASQDGSGMARQ